jgi:hypothetical protein
MNVPELLEALGAVDPAVPTTRTYERSISEGRALEEER